MVRAIPLCLRFYSGGAQGTWHTATALHPRPWFDILVASMSSPTGPDRTVAETPGPGGREWTASAEARAFGVRFGVRVTDAALLPRLLERLPPGARVCNTARGGAVLYSVVTGTDIATAGARPDWLVYAGNQLAAEVAGESELLQAFEGQVRFDVARLAARWTFVHAGVVEWKGRAILIPGASYSGKSRLVEALVRAGAGYYSDEYAALDPRGRVYPFAKPLTIRRDDGSVARVEVSDIGGACGTRPLPVGLVISTRFVPGARWQPTAGSAGSTVLALLAHTLRAQVAPERILRTLAEVAETAIMFEGDRGEAHETAGDLLAGLPT